MAQPPTTNIYYRNNTSTTNQPPQLLTNIKSTQIAAKKKKTHTRERQSERRTKRRGKKVRSTTASEWDHLSNLNLSLAKPTFKLTQPSTTVNHQIHQSLAAVKTHLPPLMNPRERFTTMANPTNPSTIIDESDAAATFPPLLAAAAAFFCASFFLLTSDCEKRKNTG